MQPFNMVTLEDDTGCLSVYPLLYNKGISLRVYLCTV